MNWKSILVVLMLITVFSSFISSNSISNPRNNGFTVNEFYRKISLNVGSLDENGNPINFVYVKTNLDKGKYDVELTHGPGDLYQIKGTDISVSLSTNLRKVKDGIECVLTVNEGYYSFIIQRVD